MIGITGAAVAAVPAAYVRHLEASIVAPGLIALGASMRVARIAVTVIAVLCLASAAQAFGTIHGFGQNAEHERITRHALACGGSGAPPACFQSSSMDELAGKNGTFGAVGAPDNPWRGLISAAYAHCDNGDFMAPSYPQSQAAAEANLTNCRKWIKTNMDAAVRDAAKLLKNGKIDNNQIPTLISCTFNGSPGRAKCNVLEAFGLILHTAQDFYSHSNWTDQADKGPTSISNPPGLGNRGPAPWLDPGRNVPFPPGLMTGCFIQGNIADIDGTGGCAKRATHYVLNKDKGQIDPTLGAGTTPRGMINGNFAHAVEAAIADTRAKWDYLRSRLIAVYGKHDGALMICALTHDNPVKDCP